MNNIQKSSLEWVDFYQSFLGKSCLIFDVGANVGNRTEIYSKIAQKVIAIEPQRDCIRELKRRFRGYDNVKIINYALGQKKGNADIYISSANTLSSLSLDWINNVKQSGRFSNYSWQKKRKVKVTTLDLLIIEYGFPEFIKIDVEGFELEVLCGLTKPTKYISIEFCTEILEQTERCLNYVSKIGKCLFNFSLNESHEMVYKNWVDKEKLMFSLGKYKNNINYFGDVYIKFI